MMCAFGGRQRRSCVGALPLGSPVPSAVRILAIADRAYLDHVRGIVDRVDDPIVADAKAPQIGGTTEFLHPGGRGVSGSWSKCRATRAKTASGSASSSFRAERTRRSSYTLPTGLGGFQTAAALEPAPDSRPALA
jgi:hypothetical protein